MFTIGGTSNRGFYPYEPTGSLRFEDGDSAYLKRTQGTPTLEKKFTISAWIKLGNIAASSRMIVGGYDNGTGQFPFYITSGHKLGFYDSDGVSTFYNISGTSLLRDPSAWYHCVLAFDSANATAADRLKIYLNGEEETLSSTLPQNRPGYANQSGTIIQIGASNNSATNLFDGYMSEIYFIDGQALDPTDFAETKNGVWIPKDASGSLTFGTNGFYLPFDDSGAIGDDESGNGNDFTTNGLASTDVVLDSPANNFPTWNPLDKSSDVTLYEGNLRYSFNSRPASRTVRATVALPSSGKYYWEFKNEQASSSPGRISFGIVKQSESSSYNTNPGSDSGYINYSYGGGIQVEGTSIGTAGSYYNTERAAIAVDCDSGKFWFGKVSSGGTTTWYNSTAGTTGDPVAGSNPVTTLSDPTEWLPFGGWHEGGSGSEFFSAAINFGQESFLGNIPNGYQVMSTANLPEPDISPANGEEPADYFNTVLWTGDNTSPRSITGVGFQPDWVWIKRRNSAKDHGLFDSVRGGTLKLESNTTAAEITGDNGKIDSFDSDGFTISTGTIDNSGVNGSGNTLVAWNWLAGGTAVSNTDGGVTSQVSANTKAGFSIVTYTADSSVPHTVGHGLDEAPELVIYKNRDSSEYWLVGWDGQSGKGLKLNDTDAAFTTSGWNTMPTATTINHNINTDDDYVAYCFHSVEGYSKIGSYTGNGSSDGPFVHCGFRPAWVMSKKTSGTGYWNIFDAERDINDSTGKQLWANSNGAEASSSGNLIDILSNGFKMRGTGDDTNTSGGTYIFIAFAEMPFKYAQAR